MNKPPSRLQILERFGMREAPPGVQEAFWRSHNLSPRQRKLPAVLGDLLPRVWPESGRRAGALVRRIAAAWQRALPAEYAAKSAVEGLTGGRLKVRVDGAATRFVLERHLGEMLIAAVNRQVGEEAVQRIDFRLDSMPGRRVPEKARKKSTRKPKA